MESFSTFHVYRKYCGNSWNLDTDIESSTYNIGKERPEHRQAGILKDEKPRDTFNSQERDAGGHQYGSKKG